MIQVDHTRERFIEQLDSPGWRSVVEEMIRQMRVWSRDLLENPDLDEAKRRGYVYARNAFKAGIVSLYDKAQRPLPNWLDQEFDYYREH